MTTLVARFVREDEAQDLIEYGLLIGLITVGVIGFIGPIGNWVYNQFSNLNTQLASGS